MAGAADVTPVHPPTPDNANATAKANPRASWLTQCLFGEFPDLHIEQRRAQVLQARVGQDDDDALAALA